MLSTVHCSKCSALQGTDETTYRRHLFFSLEAISIESVQSVSVGLFLKVKHVLKGFFFFFHKKAASIS